MKAIILILFPVLLLAQEFMIQPNGSEPVVDPFTGDIYCRVFGEGIVKIRADGSGKVVNPFPHIALPIFAHKTHKAFYVVETDNRDSTEIYQVDFENDTIYLFLKISFGGIGGISPNDKYMFLGGKTERYYSFEKDTIFDTGIRLNIQSKIDWINDSTIIYIHDENKIISFCFTQGLLDTLISLELGEYITGIAVNRKKAIISYAQRDTLLTLHFLYYTDNRDSVIYNSVWEGLTIAPYFIEYLTWDSANRKLAFIGHHFEIASSDIYVFDYEKKKTLRYTRDHYGNKWFLSWLGNSDTLIYENVHYGAVMGFALNEPLSEIPVGIEKNKENPPIIPSIHLLAYPNPFNSATTIEIRNAPAKRLKLSIYDVNGRLVFEKIVYASPGTNATFMWNGNGINNTPLASGIYFLVVKSFTSRTTFKIKPYKLVLMK